MLYGSLLELLQLDKLCLANKLWVEVAKSFMTMQDLSFAVLLSRYWLLYQIGVIMALHFPGHMTLCMWINPHFFFTY